METINRTEEIQKCNSYSVSLDSDSKPIKRGSYFPEYSVIKYKGKKAVVLVDCRDAKIKVVAGWYDDIIGMNWDGDYRFNRDKPCVVIEDGKYNLAEAHSGKLLLEKSVKHINPEWHYDKSIGYFVNGTNFDGKAIIITQKGFVSENSDLATALQTQMEEVKNWSIDTIQKEWIDKGMPCGHIRGMEWKGATLGLISTEKANELFKTHRRFTGAFNSAEWRFYDGKVILLFCDYANSDYD